MSDTTNWAEHDDQCKAMRRKWAENWLGPKPEYCWCYVDPWRSRTPRAERSEVKAGDTGEDVSDE